MMPTLDETEMLEDRLNDLARLLRALGLSDHARPISPAEVFDLCLRDIEGLRQRIPDAEADALRLHREKMVWFDRVSDIEADLAKARAVLKRLEDSGSTEADIGGGYWDACPICECPAQNDYPGHWPDCAMSEALGPLARTHYKAAP